MSYIDEHYLLLFTLAVGLTLELNISKNNNNNNQIEQSVAPL